MDDFGEMKVDKIFEKIYSSLRILKDIFRNRSFLKHKCLLIAVND